MQLDQITEQRIRAMAAQRGQDPDAAVAAAQSRSQTASTDEAATGSESKHPTFERLLIGSFPFIKVHELRSIWLGLDERIPDDAMMCGDFAVKHGGAASAPAAPEAE